MNLSPGSFMRSLADVLGYEKVGQHMDIAIAEAKRLREAGKEDAARAMEKTAMALFDCYYIAVVD